MHAVALGLACLVSGTLLGGCDALWAAYVGSYDMPQASYDMPLTTDLAVSLDLRQPPAPLCDPSDTSLVLCTTFDGQVADGSRNALKLTVSRGTSAGFTKGVLGQAAQFTTATGMYNVGDTTGFDVGDYTFETWVQPDLQPANAAMRMGLLDRDGAVGIFLYKDAQAAGQNAVVLACSVPGPAFAKALLIPLNTFSHIACTVGGTQATFYLDGEQVMMQPITPPPKTAFREVANLGSNNPTGDDQLVGALDELRFFSKVRTAAEIKAAYQRGRPPQ